MTMRRSVRDAIVGFSIIGGIAGLTGSMLWLRGISLGAKTWEITANFEDASGLAERSPVTYRGILVGSVSKIKVQQESVEAKLHIKNSEIRLSKPVLAKVITSSLLGGDVQVSLISLGKSLPINSPTPISRDCQSSKSLCEGDVIKGKPLKSISSLTEEFEKMLEKAEQQDVVSNLVDSTKQFDLTQKNLDELILQAKTELTRAKPIIKNLKTATMHMNNILAAIDNKKTLNDLQEAASSTRSIVKKIDDLGTDVNKVMDDTTIMNAIRNVTIGLGELFNELYPQRGNYRNR